MWQRAGLLSQAMTAIGWFERVTLLLHVNETVLLTNVSLSIDSSREHGWHAVRRCRFALLYFPLSYRIRHIERTYPQLWSTSLAIWSRLFHWIYELTKDSLPSEMSESVVFLRSLFWSLIWLLVILVVLNYILLNQKQFHRKQVRRQQFHNNV